MQLNTAKRIISSAVISINDSIINMSGALLEIQSSTELNDADRAELPKAIQALKSLNYANNYIQNFARYLGKRNPRERYFNFEDNELIEVKREDYNGNLNDDEETA